MFFAPRKILSALNRARKRQIAKIHVSPRTQRRLQEKYDAVAAWATASLEKDGRSTLLRCLKPVARGRSGGDVCLFVSYAAVPCIKPHVAHHLERLLAAGIDVVLIINTDQPDAEWNPGAWGDRLTGIFVRENIGFDFGAWSDIFARHLDALAPDRLILTNDSLIGPLSDTLFSDMIGRIRASTADYIGLTANAQPRYHIQSFFLVLGRRLLDDEAFRKFFASLMQLPTKQLVIDFYETRLTEALRSRGFTSEAMYPTDNIKLSKPDAVLYNFEELLSLGFPYIKVSISQSPAARAILQDHGMPDVA